MPALRVNEVFVPGKLPAYTYNPRTSAQLESRLEEFTTDGGAIVCVSGLTKMGKTVLVEKLLPSEREVWVDGSQFQDLEGFWVRVGDQLGVYPNVSMTATTGDTLGVKGSVAGSVPGIRATVETSYADKRDQQVSHGVVRPISSVALEALKKSGRAVVIDDFHFIPRDLQRQVIRSLKQPVFKGLTVVVISTSHRTLDVVLAEPNMDGRASGLDVKLWTHEELAVIANKGFSELNLIDPGGAITEHLASNAFGSPHLMQRFCKAVCRDNGFREAADAPTELSAPEDWAGFFAAQIDGVAGRWFERLLRGPQERGKQRNVWPRKDGGDADNYALIMEAMTQIGAQFEMSKDEIKSQIDKIVDGTGPAADKTTRALKRISEIAGRPLEGDAPSEEDLEVETQTDTQFVLEFVDQGPNSKLHLTDPFFAYYLRWGAPSHFA